MGVILKPRLVELHRSWLLPRYGGYSQSEKILHVFHVSCFPVTGVILKQFLKICVFVTLFPRYGGYSWVMADHLIELTVVSPLRGLFPAGQNGKDAPHGCFPITGVILFKLQNSFLFCCHYPMVKPFFI